MSYAAQERPLAPERSFRLAFGGNDYGDLLPFTGHGVTSASECEGLASGLGLTWKPDSSAALIFSEYFSAPTFLTSNGSFALIVGTSITEKELDLVRASSLAHLLLRLRNFGVGQLSDSLRSCVSQDPSFDEVRQQIQSRETGDVLSALRSEAVISRIRRATRCRFGCF